MGLAVAFLFGCILYVQSCSPNWLCLLTMMVSSFIYCPRRHSLSWLSKVPLSTQTTLCNNQISIHRRTKLDPCLSPCTKICLKWVKMLNIKLGDFYLKLLDIDCFYPLRLNWLFSCWLKQRVFVLPWLCAQIKIINPSGLQSPPLRSRVSQHVLPYQNTTYSLKKRRSFSHSSKT